VGVVKKLLLAAKHKENEDAAWDLWLQDYVVKRIAGGKIKPFEEYLSTVNNPQPITEEEYSDIIARAEQSKHRHQKSMLKRVK
jgi:hypothetical protein